MQGLLLRLLLVSLCYASSLGAPTEISLSANLSEVLAAASPNQEFLLSAGSYSIDVPIILSVPVSISGTGNTTINCDSNTFSGLNVIGGYLTLDSVTITGCSTGVLLNSSTPSSAPSRFTNCQFTVNTYGIFSNASVYVSNSTFLRNACGMCIINNSATVERSTFAFHTARDNTSGAIVAQNAPLALLNVTLYGNIGGFGGAIYARDCAVNFTYINAYENSATQGGAVFLSGNSPSTFNGVRFTTNTALDSGGAVMLDTTAKFTSNDGEMMHNYAQNGGAIYSRSSDFNIIGGTFDNNTAVGGGGALSVITHAYLVRINFTSNDAGNGGALYSSRAIVSTTSCYFYNNTATLGGVFHSTTSSSLNMNFDTAHDNRASYGGLASIYDSNAVIFILNSTRNTAGNDGGAFYVERSRCTFANVKFYSNAAPGGSGGALAARQSVVDFMTVVLENQSAMRGGAVFITGRNFTATDCAATSNYATTDGGAFAFIDVVSAKFARTNFTTNRALNGGAVYITGAIDLANVRFLGNNATLSGGAVYALGSTANIRDSLLSGNNAMNGGALSSLRSSVSLVSTIMMGNKADTQGGALEFSESASLYLSNCTISNNEADFAGGVFVQGSSVEITFSKIVNNSANIGGGIYVTNITALSLLSNNNIQDNSASNSSGIYIDSDKNLFHIRNTLIATVSPNLVFCCNGNRLLNPQGAVCNYPTCDAQCREAVGCACPFVSPPIVISIPVLPSSYSNCTCLGGRAPGNFCIAPNPCPFGFAQSNAGCSDVNECLSPTACDLRVNCTNMNGTYACGVCPTGFVGDARAVCRSLCGDGKCDAAIGENCVSCSLDCKQQACSECGDGVCDTDESCSTCDADCGACQIPTCKNGCSGRGQCVNGVCQCTGSWTGPTCNTNNEPIEFTPNKTAPIAGGSVRTVLFSIAVRSLIERDASGAIVSQLGLDAREQNFTFVESPLFGSSANTMWVYSTALSNKAIVNVTFISFQEESTKYTFANQTSAYPANTLKVNLRVSQWPFRSIANTLQVAMETDAKEGKESGCVPVTSSSADSEGNLLWVKVTLNSVAFYGQFVPYSVVDGRTRKVQFSLNSNDKMVYATLPHFWNSAEFDPSYTVLIDSSDRAASCGKKNNKNPVIIGVVVSVVGVILIAGAVVLFVRMRKRKHTNNLLGMKMKKSNAL